MALPKSPAQPAVKKVTPSKTDDNDEDEDSFDEDDEDEGEDSFDSDFDAPESLGKEGDEEFDIEKYKKWREEHGAEVERQAAGKEEGSDEDEGDEDDEDDEEYDDEEFEGEDDEDEV